MFQQIIASIVSLAGFTMALFGMVNADVLTGAHGISIAVLGVLFFQMKDVRERVTRVEDHLMNNSNNKTKRYGAGQQ